LLLWLRLRKLLLTVYSHFLTEVRWLCFASLKTYPVHKGLLNTFEEANSLHPWSDTINLKDVPEGVGRVFIDYLYSGLCQLSVAEKPEASKPEHPHILETSLQVYCFARRYRVEKLVRLVKEQITQLARSSRPLTLLEAAKRACNPESKEDRWLQDLVRSHSCLLFRESEHVDQDAVYRLLSPFDSVVSQTLLRELLLCCRAHADTPAASTLGDEDSLGRSCDPLGTSGIGGQSPSPANHPAEALEPEPAPAEKPWPEAEPVPADDPLPELELALAEEPWPEAELVLVDDLLPEPEPAPDYSMSVKMTKKKDKKDKMMKKEKKKKGDTLEQQQWL
jgi:hypothetical protein